MAIEDFFDHKCDIYHIVKSESSPGYGLPCSPGFSYSAKPDIAELPCHFGVKGSSMELIQREPQMDYEAKIKLTLPAGTDIRRNDKIIDCSTGYEYIAEIPRNIRNHHTFVYLKREEGKKAI